MRTPTIIKPWLEAGDLLQWTREATTPDELRRRLSIWLTHIGRYHAHRVAELLGVSVISVWRWLSQYNRLGPEGLHRQGRGGRRWSFLSLSREEKLLQSLVERAATGQLLSAKQLLPEVCKVCDRKVSLAYVYRLLRRHQWRKLAARPHHVKVNPAHQQEFKKNSLRKSK